MGRFRGAVVRQRAIASAALLVILAGYSAIGPGPLVTGVVAEQLRVALAVAYLKGALLALGLPIVTFLFLSATTGETIGRVERAGRVVFLGYAAFYVVCLVTLGVLKTRSFHTYADLATDLETLWRATHGLGLTSPMSEEAWGGQHWFAAHFTPIAYLVVIPAFRMFPGPSILVVLQTVALLSAIIPVMWYAAHRLGKPAAFWVGAAFLAYPTLQYINLSEFEYLRLSIPFLAWAVYALHRRWTRTYWLMCVLALLTREEVSLVVFMLGLYSAVVRKERVLGLATAGIALVYFLTVVGIVMPSFRAGGDVVYQRWFPLLSEIGHHQVKGPTEYLRRLVVVLLDPIRIANALMFLIPFELFSLLSPRLLVIAAPNVASTFSSGSMTHYAFFLYYLSPSVPFIVYSAVDGMARVREWLDRSATAGEASRGGGSSRAGVWVAASVAVGSLLSNVFFGPSPLSLQFWNHDYTIGEFHTTSFHRSNYVVTSHSTAAQSVVDAVPRDAIISAEQPFLPHLYDRTRMYVFPTLKEDVEYVLIDRKHPLKTGWAETYLDFRRRPEFYYGLIENDSDRWAVVAESDGVRLFRRRVAQRG